MATRPLSQGRQFEYDVLGVTLAPGQTCRMFQPERLHKTQRRRRPARSRAGIDCLPFGRALDQVFAEKKFIIGRPDAWPKGILARRLYWLVVRRFRKVRQKIKMYATVGTALDLHYGVDLIFCLGNRTVTVDLSCGLKRTIKADFLLTPRIIDHKVWLEFTMNQIARQLDYCPLMHH